MSTGSPSLHHHKTFKAELYFAVPINVNPCRIKLRCVLEGEVAEGLDSPPEPPSCGVGGSPARHAMCCAVSIARVQRSNCHGKGRSQHELLSSVLCAGFHLIYFIRVQLPRCFRGVLSHNIDYKCCNRCLVDLTYYRFTCLQQ